MGSNLTITKKEEFELEYEKRNNRERRIKQILTNYFINNPHKVNEYLSLILYLNDIYPAELKDEILKDENDLTKT
jgi:hypothetical protein